VSQQESGNGKNLVRATIAAILGTAAFSSYAPGTFAAEAAATVAAAPDKESDQVEEVRVTGSRIVRKDMTSNSPLVTVDQQKIEDSPFISVEEALNDMPQFMAGGAGMTSAAVTSLQGANGVDGGRGTGDASNSTLLPDNAGIIGIVVPGAANVNLRGLGAGRSLTLINGHRGMPENAGMTVDLNTIPTIAMAGVEVITGGASAVYGADALAGVTNIRLRENFEGLKLQVRSGVNEVGDGAEVQVGGLMGAKIADGRGSVLIGIEYSKRNSTLWREHSAFREVLESPYSSNGDYAFIWNSYYTSSSSATAGQFFPFLGVWAGNQPTTAAALSIFPNRTCGTANCITSAGNPFGGGWVVNQDGSIYIRSSQTPTANGVALAYGPQNYRPRAEDPVETSCTFSAPTVNATTGAVTSQTVAAPGTAFAGSPCSPTQNRIDWDRRITGPREGYTLVGNANYDITDHLTAFASFNFAASDTETRREPAPFSGPTFGVAVPFAATDVNGLSPIYLPSVVQVGSAAAPVGSTVTSYRAGGTKGTNCPATGGCTMAQAFPLPGDVFDSAGRVTTRGGLRTLLESRTTPTGNITSGAFQGLPNNCTLRTVVAPGTPGAILNPVTNAYYITQTNPDTNTPLTQCGPNSRWAMNTQLGYLPPRGTLNNTRLYNFSAGLRGDTGLGDWTWEYYMSQGDSKTTTDFVGFAPLSNYARLMTAPNYGRGFDQAGVSSKFLTCESGLGPFDQGFSPSADCLEALSANEVDRSDMTQRIHEISLEGGLFDLPAGQVRSALGATYRRNEFVFKPDSIRELDYIGDTSAGAFGSGDIDAGVTAKEIYGEMLVPVLKDLPFVNSLELELGYRYSDYSTGQAVDTYKILASWEPLDWLRLRGGYNRAERAPNIAELFQTPTGSAQFSDAAIDPCRNDTVANGLNVTVFNGRPSNQPATDPAVRARLQALCSAMINNSASAFDADPNNFNDNSVAAILLDGNENLKNEQGDTWTVGLAFRSPFESPLLARLTGTVDWYEARVADPIDVTRTNAIVNSCYNINGTNPELLLDDPNGYCKLIERDQVSGAISRVFNPYENQDKLVIRGLDVGLNWSAALTDLGFDSLPGSVSLSLTANYLMDQIQRYSGSPDRLADYAGFNGASRIRSSTGIGYNWGRHRAILTWQYRLGTQSPTTFAATPNITGTQSPTIKRSPLFAGYRTFNQINATFGTKFGPVNASLGISNLLNTKPSWGGYDLRDPLDGFGSFSPFDDLTGRRYSLNLSVDL
jgi:outer membrane receptor protein involved in Fe transport